MTGVSMGSLTMPGASCTRASRTRPEAQATTSRRSRPSTFRVSTHGWMFATPHSVVRAISTPSTNARLANTPSIECTLTFRQLARLAAVQFTRSLRPPTRPSEPRYDPREPNPQSQT